MLFPIVPIVCLIGAMGMKYLMRRDWTIGCIVASHSLQLLMALLITLFSTRIEGIHIFSLMRSSPIAIVFEYSREKLFFLWAFMCPLVLSLFRLKSLGSSTMRMVFLFYLSGCSGLVVTGDIFNFFVFYELMIMAAYVLISVNGEYGASVKYMLFGSVSSIVFLAGIVVLYASGAYFGFDFAGDIGQAQLSGVWLALLLFCVAFFIKGAFFPVSGWVAPCHSAANTVVSSFLASFTIFTGILGLYQLVLIPAATLGLGNFFVLVRIVSLLTIVIASFMLYWEPSLKRCIAASTVFTIGLVGLLLSFQLYEPAMYYVLMHAAYKSLLFYLYEGIETTDDQVGIGLLPALVLLVVLPLVVGVTPTVTAALKQPLLIDLPAWYKIILVASGVFVMGGFAKFHYRIAKIHRISHASVAAFLFVIVYGLWTIRSFPPVIPQISYWLVEWLPLVLICIFARWIFKHITVLHRLDYKTIYHSLNQELLLVLVLLIGSGLFFLHV
jgi:formate hydrogenlyase subunit 3/multisubunit Na+/H+ antiporter MnhD subunit